MSQRNNSLEPIRMVQAKSSVDLRTREEKMMDFNALKPSKKLPSRKLEGLKVRRCRSYNDIYQLRKEKEEIQDEYIDGFSNKSRFNALKTRLVRNNYSVSHLRLEKVRIEEEVKKDGKDGKELKAEDKPNEEERKEKKSIKKVVKENFKKVKGEYKKYREEYEKLMKWKYQTDFVQDTRYYVMWKMLIFLIYCYYFIFQLYRMSFMSFQFGDRCFPNENNKGVTWVYIIDVTCDILVVVHMYIHKFPNRSDFFFIFPIDSLALLLWSIFEFRLDSWWHFTRFNRVGFAFYRYNHFFHYFNRVFQQNLFVKILKYYLLMLGCFNVMACAWYIALTTDKVTNVIQFTPHEDLPFRSEIEIYLYAYHWCLVTMTGYGGTTPSSSTQIVYGLFICLIGCILYISTIGSVFSLIEDVDNKTSRQKHEIDRIKNYMNFLRIDPEISERVMGYYKFLFRTNRSWDEKKILSELPHYLKVSVLKDIHHKIVNAVPMFQTSSQSFIAEIIQNLKPRVALPNSVIIKQGGIGNEMYFLARGKVEVRVNGNFIVELKSGSFFGEIALVMNKVRTASIIAKEYCDLYVLQKRDFDKLGKTFKNEIETIREAAIRRELELQEAKNKRPDDDDETPPDTPLSSDDEEEIFGDD